jgi:hypothetical protein
MATSPLPVALKSLSDLKLDLGVSATLPGEAVITALISFANTARSNMDPALRTRLDVVLVQQIEDLQRVWRSLWIRLGVVQ